MSDRDMLPDEGDGGAAAIIAALILVAMIIVGALYLASLHANGGGLMDARPARPLVDTPVGDG